MRNILRGNHILFIILPLILFICFTAWQFKTNFLSEDIASDNGLWDVRDIDFAVVGARLIGDVEFVPNELLEPEEYALSNHRVTGTVPDGTDYGTFCVRILAEEGTYGFARFTPGYAARVFEPKVSQKGTVLMAWSRALFDPYSSVLLFCAMSFKILSISLPA